MTVRVLNLTAQQQKIIKMHIDGKTKVEIMHALDVEECDVYVAISMVDRALPKFWLRSASECWSILKDWNIASTLMLILCLAPVFEANNHNTDRVRSTKTSRISSRIKKETTDPFDIFDLFEIC